MVAQLYGIKFMQITKEDQNKRLIFGFIPIVIISPNKPSSVELVNGEKIVKSPKNNRHYSNWNQFSWWDLDPDSTV